MLPKHVPEQVHDIWAELDGQQAQYKETHEAAREDCQQEAEKSHFRDCRSQDEQFEGRGRRQHRGQHKAPERMPVERPMNLFEALRRNALAEEFLSPGVADPVDYDAAQRRSGRRHESVEQESAAILVDVAGHDRVDGETDEGAVDRGHHQHAPRAQGLQQCP